MADKIKTVVVLIQENRSFDHMLGWMKSLNPEIDGVTGAEVNYTVAGDASSTPVHFGNASQYVDPDPGHSFMAIYEQVYGNPYPLGATAPPATKPGVAEPPMSGFAQQAEKEAPGMAAAVMNGFWPDAVPVYRELVREFAVCDRWFASVPTMTQPNRMFVHSATSHGLIDHDKMTLLGGLPQRTIFDALHDAGHSFGIYFQFPPTVLLYRNMRQLKYFGNFHDYELHFKQHCREGKLPNYVVIEQRYMDLPMLPGNDDHPSHDVANGQHLIKDVYEALRSSPQWNEILFVITYDEHGGFFDHVPTPVVGVPSPDGVISAAPISFAFDRLGVRVPAMFISPWIEPGTVIHRPSGPEPTSQYEHSSIPATVKKIFNLKEFLTKRDAWAGTFDNVLTRATPRTDCPETLPEPPVLLQEADAGAEDRKVSAFQAELVQLGAALNGNHAAEAYESDKLVKGITELVQLGGALNGNHAAEAYESDKLIKRVTVVEASEYCWSAFARFRKECQRCHEEGMDESHIPTL